MVSQASGPEKDPFAEADRGNTLFALVELEMLMKQRPNPKVLSYLGYCVAKEKRNVRKGVELCLAAINKESSNPIHYLNLGRIHLLSGDKDKAFSTFRKGLKMGRDKRIMRYLRAMGIRKSPVIASLARDHAINKLLGKIFSRLKLR